MVRMVETANGSRRLAVESWGDPEGTPVFLFHGTPGSRNGPRPRGVYLHLLGINLICYDRPGYGLSDRRQGRAVADAVDDVALIAEKLRIDRFSVVGRSGGGPHALACAALLKEQVTHAAVLVSLAPADASDLEWYGGMTDSNVQAYQKADSDRTRLLSDLTRRSIHIRKDPEYLLRSLTAELDAADRRVVEDPALRALLTDTYEEALRCGAYGWIDDVLALRRSWGFDLKEIKAPTLLWHGADDKFSPVEHTRWLADRIQNSELRIESDAAHFGAFEVLPDVLAWITEPDPSVRRFRPIHAGLRR